MNFEINMNSSIPIYQQILQEICLSIARGELVAGDKLPSVRELALQLSINPNTVQAAYRELLRDNVLHSRKGIGLFIAEDVEEMAKDERKRQMKEKIDELLLFGSQLGFTKKEIAKMIEEVQNND